MHLCPADAVFSFLVVMHTATVNPQNLKLLKEPLTEFFQRVSLPANLSKTLNRLIFDGMLKGLTLLPDEIENVHALSDFLLACQVAQTTVILADA
jgi:hypothetical protein